MTITETRYKSIEENVKKLESQLQLHMEDVRKVNEGTEVKMDKLGKKLDFLMAKLLPPQDGLLGNTPKSRIWVDL